MIQSGCAGKGPRDWPFPNGKSGGGRPKGSRNKLGERFLEALAEDWEEHGRQAIVNCREEKPTEYVKVVASLLPKELLVRRRKDVAFTEVDVEQDPEAGRAMVARRGGRRTVPQIFIGPTHVGSADELQAMEDSGKLDSLLAWIVGAQARDQ